MRQSGFRAWKVAGGLAFALVGLGCGYLPVTGGQDPQAGPRTFIGSWEEPHHVSPDRGYNGTIQQLGSSIDPRTPETEGMRGNSRLVDVTGRPAPSTQLGTGGSGRAGEPEGEGSSDLGWRARRGYDLGPGADYGPAVPSMAP
jgi:hypothetical protein